MRKLILSLLALALSFSAASFLINRTEDAPLLPTASPYAPRAEATSSPSPSAPLTPTPTVEAAAQTAPVQTAAPTVSVAVPTSGPTAAPTDAPIPTSAVTPTAAPLVLPEGTPDFTLTGANGETKKLSDFLGKPIVLNFWASWCEPCKSELPAFQEAYDLYGQEVTFLLVSLDSNYATAQNFLRENALTVPFWRDASSVGRNAYGVAGIPQTFFLSAEGRIVSKKIGALSKSALINAIGQIR